MNVRLKQRPGSPEPPKMHELQLRQELRSRFPQISGAALMKVMKMYDNDPAKCIRALEQEIQFLRGASSDPNSNQRLDNHNQHINHNPGEHINRSSNQQPNIGISDRSHSQINSGMPRYQELPVKHETTHISTVRHTVGPPSFPTTLPSSDKGMGSNIHQNIPHVQQSHPLLFIDPINRDSSVPHTAPVRPFDFTPFMNVSPRRQADIPSIRCGPSSLVPGAVSESGSETRRPVRVINVQGYPSGGTVTSGPGLSFTSANSNSSYKVMRGDGGGLCSTPSNSAPVTPPNINPYQFSGQAHLQPELRAIHAERPTMHSSRIYIDPTSKLNRTNLQESKSDSSLNAQAHTYGHSSPLMPRVTQPITVSVASFATSQGTSEREQNTVSFAELAYNISPGNTPSSLPSGGYMMNVSGDSVNQFTQEGASPSPPRPSHSLSMTLQGINQLSISPGSGVGVPTPTHSASSPSIMGMGIIHPYSAVSPVLVPKSHRLQHQRSTGSSTSRSNSMDSEHGSTHPSDPVCDPLYPPRPSPPTHYHRGVMGMNMAGMGMPMLSPASSQSSLSSESSARDREPNAIHRQRSGSMQEEDAYMQALLEHQRQRMNKLTEDIDSKQRLLLHLRKEVSDVEQSKIPKNSIGTAFPTGGDISQLCQINRRLQTDIQMFLNEIDMYKNGQTPFGVIDPMSQQNFFNNMPTGPNDLFTRQQNQCQVTPPPRPPRQPTQPRTPPQPPQRVNSNDLSTPVPAPAPGQSQGGGSADSEEGERWACTACTFENHPALKKCEMCEMPRLVQGCDGVGAGMGLVGSVSMPQLHHLGILQGGHPDILHRGAGGEVCYCHNRTCQQKLHKV